MVALLNDIHVSTFLDCLISYSGLCLTEILASHKSGLRDEAVNGVKQAFGADCVCHFKALYEDFMTR